MSSSESPASGLGRDSALRWILLLALALRAVVIFAAPSIHHPDEIFQFLEPAHRLAFGYGIQTWEFSDGMRSLLLPYLFGRLLAAVALLGGGPQTYVLVTRALLAVLSLLAIGVVYRSALRQSRTHALLAGLVAASWFEIVYFSSRPLTEAIATHFLLMGVALASRAREDSSPWEDGAPPEDGSPRFYALVGFMLGCCMMLRIQLAPGAAVAAVWVLRNDLKRRLTWMLLGGLLPVVMFGVADYVAWGSYFHSYVTYVTANVLQGKANAFGVTPFYWFAKNLIQTWAGAFPLLAVLIVVGWRQSKLWVLVALVILAVHSLIPHKEYRFVYPAHACLIIAAALGCADVVEKIRAHFGPERGWQAQAAAVTLWIATSGSLALGATFLPNWSAGSQLARSFLWLHDEPRVCGIELLDHSWEQTGGYTHLHRNIPVYDSVTDPRTESMPMAYNYIVLDRKNLRRLPDPYRVQRCFGALNPTDVCVATRPGACTTIALPPLLEQKRLGELTVPTLSLP